MKTAIRQYIIRQGDVILKQVSSHLPTTTKEIKGEIVLAQGEVTGHAHRIVGNVGDARLFEENDGPRRIRYLVINHRVVLHHEEHKHESIDPGTYEVLIQQEYTPTKKVNVND